MNFNINNKLIFIYSFQFVSSSLDSSVKNLGKDDFKCLNQNLDSKVLYLVSQRKIYIKEYMRVFSKI